ncbi:LOW QUALITY PROTEIN: uncharacterized protein [Argopecten irradians]|uniref:LOW QUALITY PROTEIN: uncharacterized protein n=1 Tax=Argopecten irradians TaxID=31199 RepID=UPI003720B994
MVTDEAHQKICKALVRGSNVDENVVQSICETNPMAVMKVACKLIREECTQLSKRGSGSALQKKDFEDFFTFHWEMLHEELQRRCPALLSAVTAIVCDTSPNISTKPFHHILLTTAIGLHGRSQEMSLIQFMCGFILTHGGCTQRNIEKLSQIGLSVHPMTVQRKLTNWKHNLDAEIVDIRESWANGGSTTYQLIGDNWDKNILPSFRTSDRKTLSLHLFNVYAIVDRVTFDPENVDHHAQRLDVGRFIPSVEEQQQLMKELCFIVSTSVIQNHPKMQQLLDKVYPKHLEHHYSEYAGVKTKQFQLGLFDTNENKTQELIRLLKEMSQKYVPHRDGEIVEPVFFGGDRLTDERIQSAQQAMANADTPSERLEGFISKIEDFHRLMNFMEAIHKMTYSTKSSGDIGTAYYFRNVLNMRNVKGNMCNSYRAYKLLYYAMLDALCLLFFLNKFNNTTVDDEVAVPHNFENMTDAEKVMWIDNISASVLKEWFFDKGDDICQELREIVGNPDHPENYWIANQKEDGRVKCHFCDKTYAYVGSLKAHELKEHGVSSEKHKAKPKRKDKDELHEYILMLFKLVILHKNLDTGVDMGDGERVVRSAKYELPIYNRTNKVKYSIGSIHLTSLTTETLPEHQRKRLTVNRFVNVQGGKNNNISLDEYLEMLNRDSKIACSGHQTKNSILQHSKEYPHLINFSHYFEDITQIKKRKGFHHLPPYKTDVQKILKDFAEQDVLTEKPNRHLQCKDLVAERNPFNSAFRGLSTMIHRHQPVVPYHRLRDPHI